MPRKARADLAHRLLVSLEDDESSPEVEAAWKAEVTRRYEDYQQGKAKTKPAKEVMRDAYRSLKA